MPINENTMQLFENYPYMEQVIIDHKLENLLDRIKWHTFEDADMVRDGFRNVLDTFSKLTSANIPYIMEGKEQALNDYRNLSSSLHVFSREQGRHELGLSNEDVARIFSRVEIGGAKYCSKEKPQLLF